LTEDILCVLEDNYDGTYAVHFEIPCKRIKRVEPYQNTDADSYGSGGNTEMWATWGGVLGGILGWASVRSSTQSSSKTARDQVLTIVFDDEAGEAQQIWFNEVAGSIRKFSKAVQNLTYGKLY